MDVIFTSLQNQSFKDFELIWVDNLHQYRAPLIQGHLSLYDISYKHIPPRQNHFPYGAFATSVNTALANANGEIVLITADYTYLPHDCLEKHAAYHKANPNAGYMGSHTYWELPTMRTMPGLKNEDVSGKTTHLEHIYFVPVKGTGKTEVDNKVSKFRDDFDYVASLEAGELNEMMWSAFEQHISEDPSDRMLPNKQFKNVDGKLFRESGPIGFEWCHLKNESFPLECALNINGLDEDFNGTHGWQDTEFADRLSLHAGIRWHFDASNKADGFWARDDFPQPKRLRPHFGNMSLYEFKKWSKYVASTNDWNIKEERKKILGLA